MKKSLKQFLLITYVISYICFGILVYSRVTFNNLFNDTLNLSIFILGFLSPFISAIIVYALNKEELGGISGLIGKFKKIKTPNSIILVPIFLIAHYAFGIFLNNVDRYGSLLDFLYYIPIMFILFGSQELGWRLIVQPYFEEKNGFWKSCITTGLLWALWFLPLIYIPQFVILPQFYAQFAAYLIGISLILTTLYKVSGSIVYCVILSTLIFAMSPVIDLKQGFMLVAIAVLDAIFITIFKDKNFNEELKKYTKYNKKYAKYNKKRKKRI